MSDDDQTTLFERHPWLFEMRSVIESIANTQASVLIRGESSRMCEIVARAIHVSSASRGVFVKANCTFSSPDAFEGELFGVEIVMPTGRHAKKSGLMEFRESTLYLEDIAKMPPGTQAKFLRALRDRRVLRQGGRVPIDVDVRVIAATNRDLKDAVARGEFLGELYNLLKVAEIPVPPLTKEERDLAKAEEEEQARRERARLEPIDAHNEACRAFARTGPDEGLICPHCGRRSREDIEFVDYTGRDRKSFFVCRACGRSFGHELCSSDCGGN